LLVFFCKTGRALPYISEQYRSKSIWNRIRSWFINVPIKNTEGRVIEIATWPNHIKEDGAVVFEESDRPEAKVMKDKTVKPDMVVFATGYKKEFPFLDPQEYRTAIVPDVRGIYNEDDITVSFIGFIRPSLGAIPPLAEMQAQLWVYRLLHAKYPQDVLTHSPEGAPVYPNTLAHYELDWKLRCRGGYDFFNRKGGVDHEAYTYQLALDIGSAPTWTYVWKKGWKVFFTWGMGANFTTKFRLAGPWKDDRVAAFVMETELYDVVKKTGGLVCTYYLAPKSRGSCQSQFMYFTDFGQSSRRTPSFLSSSSARSVSRFTLLQPSVASSCGLVAGPDVLSFIARW
jgi:dimethylaniline monooxygenase (N-oxide forming)